MNEESKDADKVPGRAALLTVTSILATYLLLGVATQMYAGVGDTGLGLNNPETSENVLGSLAAPVLGEPLNLLLFLAVLASSAASLITTFLPTTRTMLAMGRYGALPARFATIHPKYPDAVLRHRRRGHHRGRVLLGADGVQRERLAGHDLLPRHHDLLLLRADRVRLHLVFPGELFGNLQQLRVQIPGSAARRHRSAGVLLVTLRDSASPDYGSGASIGGVGLVLILGLGLILIGVFVMFYLSRRHPAFFRGETLRRDTPAFVAD